MSLFLNTAEIIDLTTKHRGSGQVQVLRAMGINHKIRPDGSIAILRAHITEIFGGRIESSRQTKEHTPNLRAVRQGVSP